MEEQHTVIPKSRYEQAPGSEFHPGNEKSIVVFWDLLGAIKR